MRYVVTGGTGFIGRRVVSRSAGHPTRRRGVGPGPPRSRWGASNASPPSGANGRNRWSATCRELALTDEAIAELGDVDHRGALRGDLRHHRRRGRAAGRQCRGHPRRDRAGPAAGRHVASRVVDRGGGRLRRRVHRGRLRRRPATADAVSPDQVRGRVAGARRRPGCATGSTAPRWWWAIRAPARWTRSTGRTTSSGVLAKLAVLPRFTPILLPDTGRTNIVPVDYVVDALVALMHADGSRRADIPPDRAENHWAARHLPRGRQGGRAAAAARVAAPLGGHTGAQVRGRAKVLRNMAATQLGIPAEILDVVDLAPTFISDETRNTLQRHRDSEVPEFASYAPKLWRYWAEHLDPDRARRDDPAGPLDGRHVIITGASSGIGRASAIAVAERGATVFALARNADALDELVAEIRATGGQALRLHLRRHRLHVGRAHRQRHPGPLRPRRLPGEQRRPVDPPLGGQLHRPAARLRTGDGGQLLRRGADGAGAAAALARTPVRPRRQRVQRGRAGPQSEYSSYLPTKAALDAFADVVAAGDAVRPHHLHQHPHATGQDADDRAVAAAQPGAGDQPRARGGDGGARPRRKAGAHRHPAGHARRRRQLLRAEVVAANSASALSGLSRIRRPRAGVPPPSRCGPSRRRVAGPSARCAPSPRIRFPDRSSGGAPGARSALVDPRRACAPW